MKQTITRKGSFDAGHRVMYERMKCYNIHGHTYHYELTFEYNTVQNIGYAIDFKEIKRIACDFIDEKFDHGFICNPQDTEMLQVCDKLNSKMWLMSLDLRNFCNPTAENISKEIFLSIERLMNRFELLTLMNVRLHETPNCFVDCNRASIDEAERQNFLGLNYKMLDDFSKAKGIIEYDIRKLS